MKEKFTSGEWRVEKFVNGKGFEIAFNNDGEVVADYVYTEPDAHLIAAAPKMYAMLERAKEAMLNTYDVNDHPADGNTECDNCARDIDKLLAEARGE